MTTTTEATYRQCLACDATVYGDGPCVKCQEEARQREEQEVFDAVMWGWLTPRALAIVERERLAGDIPVA